MTRNLRTLSALILVLVVSASTAFAEPSDSTISETRRYTIDWTEAHHSGSPPYLKGYTLLESSRPGGSGYVGSYTGTGAEYTLHRSLISVASYPFEITGSEADSEFVVALNIPWSNQFNAHPAVVGSLLVTMDGTDSLVVVVAFRDGRHFFSRSGSGSHHSYPEVLVFDIPRGEHVVELRMLTNPARVALLVCGVLNQEAESDSGAVESGDVESGESESEDAGGG